jgi:L-ascorbate metabolism protein UlaG (beta-lactamase superfamily)
MRFRLPIKTLAAAVTLLGAGLALGACALLEQPTFGGTVAGERLASIQASSNYADGAFRNAVATPMGGSNGAAILSPIRNLFRSREGLVPTAPLPAVKTDLRALDRARDVVVWLGHSSYFVQLAGRRILVDPVFSPSAAPIAGYNKAFDGTSIYSAEDMPEIDYLLITHDHYDHLDHPSVVALRDKTRIVVTGLGVGAHFERWGYSAAKVREGDWFTSFEPDAGFKVHVLPAQHYSGRTLKRNQTLWASFALEAGGRRLYFGGDSGYGPHFAEIGRRLGGFDLVALDSGQYDDRWAPIHMRPEEAVQAARDLGATAMVPAHVGRFRLAWHRWEEPFERLQAASVERGVALLTPVIGEPVAIAQPGQVFASWWKKVNLEKT